MPASPHPSFRNGALRERRGVTTSQSSPYTLPHGPSSRDESLRRAGTSSSRIGVYPGHQRTGSPTFYSRIEHDSNSPTTERNARVNDAGYPVPCHLVRRQSAPDQLQQNQVATIPVGEPSLGNDPTAASPPQITLWHRPSSPTPRKLGDTSFTYRDLEKNEVRLLRILPEASSVIKCEIIHASLDNPQKYTAISYAWGDLEDTNCIVLDGHEFPITESLWHALQRLRSRATAVVVWADAICINQRNTAERNSQVQFMTNIYTKAGEMAIWIGPDTEHSNEAIGLLHNVVGLDGSPSEIKEIIMSPSWRQHFRALVALFNRDYWKRLWVVQEVMNSSNITVHCGSSALPWRTYARASEIFVQHKRDLIRAFLGVSYSEGLGGNYPWETFLCHRGPAGLRNMDFPSYGSIGMLQALLYHRPKLCTEPRDRVYGILGILSAEERSQFPVDYNISTIEVYTNVVDYILTTTKRLDVICASIHYPKHQMMERLPSWVPDWSYYPSIGPLFSYNNRFCASGKTTAATFSFLRRRRELSISGIRIDNIATCGIQLGVPINMSAIILAFFQWRLRLIQMKGSHDQTVHEAFCRTLCLDRSIDRWTAEEWMVWTYHLFYNLLQERLPGLDLDAHLKFYATNTPPISAGLREQTFSDYFIGAMAGRRFALTMSGLLCLGAGCVNDGDIVCIPLGCSTPVLLREHSQGYLFVGDVYVDGYMYGRAMEELKSGTRQLETFVLH